MKWVPLYVTCIRMRNRSFQQSSNRGRWMGGWAQTPLRFDKRRCSVGLVLVWS